MKIFIFGYEVIIAEVFVVLVCRFEEENFVRLPVTKKDKVIPSTHNLGSLLTPGAAPGGQFFFFFLAMIIPLPHSENLLEIFLKSEKQNVSESPHF